MEKNLDYFKKKVIAILKQKDDEVTPGIKKSLDDMDYVYGLNNYDSFGSLEKSYGVGTVRIWKGKKYKKVSQNPTKWVRVYDKVDRGAKGSMTRLINKADSCKSIEELYQFCMSNHAIFKDQNGVDLPIMDELRAAVDEKKKRLENGDTSSIRPEKKTAKKQETPKVDKNSADYKKKFKLSYEYRKKIGVNDTKEQLEEIVKLFEGNMRENDPDFMGQYQAVLELLADKVNEKKENPENKPLTAEEKQNVLDRIDDILFTRNGVYGGDSTYNELQNDNNKVIDYLKKHEPKLLINLENISKDENKSVNDILKDSYNRAVAESQSRFINDKYGNSSRNDIITAIRDTEENLKLAEKNKDNAKIIRYNNQLKALKALNESKYVEEQKESEAEKHQNRSDAMKGNKNAWKGGPKVGDKVIHNGTDNWEITDVKEKNGQTYVDLVRTTDGEGTYNSVLADTLKKEQEPEAPKVNDVEASKADMKKYEELFNKYTSDWDNGITYYINKVNGYYGKEPHSKASARNSALNNILKMKAELEPLGIKVPDIPEDIQKKWDEWKEARKGVASYMSTGDNILSGIKQSKFEELAKNVLQPLKDAYKKASENVPKFENGTSATNPIVEGKTNQEQAELFDTSKADDGKTILTYNGKPYSKIVGWGDLGRQREMVAAAGMDPKAQIDYVKNHYLKENNFWGISSSLKKYGEKKLKELLKDPTMPDEEFYSKLLEKCTENYKDYGYMYQQIENHEYNKRVEEEAKRLLEKYDDNNNAIGGVDLPVDPKDMDEAENIIGRKVAAIAKTDWNYERSLYRAELKKMIEGRLRNNPALARAMLVYIKNYQAENNTVIFTPKNEIWDQLPKLNENALNSVMSGETETKTGESGELYTGDGVTSVIENKDIGRYQVTFNGKPDEETRTILKRNGFRWAPSSGTWQAYNTANGERSLARVAEELGWKKNS